MEGKKITEGQFAEFAAYLRKEERAEGTIKKYQRDVYAFARWLGDREVTKEMVTGWKEWLLKEQYAPATINGMLAAVNIFLRFMGWENCRVRFLKIQRQMFRDASKELSRAEYDRLIKAAKEKGKDRLALLLETIGGTGIRVSEIRHITVEAAKQGRAEIYLKGKIRAILLPNKLCRKLLKYAGKNKIASGEIFLTGSGKHLCRRQIWTEMKWLCRYAEVEPSKVFPHNLRHLFATTFYKTSKDIVRLADILGHSSIETTRIYLLITGNEYRKQLEQLGLIL